MSRKFKRFVSLLLVTILVIPTSWVTPVAKAATTDVIPVILFHRIVETPTNEWTDTSIKEFEKMMKYLDENGYTTLSAEQYVSVMEGKVAKPEKPILLTFDDATPDFVTNALPILKKYNMNSVLFVVSDWIGAGFSMSTEQLQSLTTEPSVSIQNHTRTHDGVIWGTDGSKSSIITQEQAEDQIIEANKYIKSISGKDPILMAYPYGSFNEISKQVNQDNGIKYAFKVGYPNGDNFAMGRHYITNQTVAQFAALIGGPAPAPEPEEQPEIETVYHETFADGVGNVTQAGNAKIEAVSEVPFEGNDDGKAIHVSNRANNWDGVDINFDNVGMENGKTYTITVKGYVADSVTVPTGAQVLLQNVDSYNGLYVQGDFAANQTFTLTGKYTVDTSKDRGLRIQSNDVGATVPFYIGDILITTEKTTAPEVDKEIYHETFAGGVGVAIPSGGASVAPVTEKVFAGNDDGAAIYVSNRANDYDAADFNFTNIGLENGKTYKVTVKGYVDGDATIPSGGQVVLSTVSSYTWLTNVNFVAGEAFTLTKEFTVDTSKDEKLRVQSNPEGKTVPFYIGDILITEKVTGDVEEPEDPRAPAQEFTPITFEDGELGGFEGRAGTETLTVVEVENHTVEGTKALKVENRTNTWHGPALRVEQFVDKGAEYKISAWVKLISPDSSQLQLSTQVGDGDGASYNNLQGKTISTADGWVKLEGMYRYSSVGNEFLTIYVESTNNSTASFYIDDITFEKTGSGPIEVQDLTPIKDVYKDDFLIGSAVSAKEFDGNRLKLLNMHHNVVTAENAMKPSYAYNEAGEFDFTAEDELVAQAKAQNLKMVGHVLVWHQQSNESLHTDENGNPLSREEALKNLKEHVNTVVTHFGDDVISWDVVNEAMNDNPSNPTDWKASLRQSGWLKAIGTDYIEQAFLAAKEALKGKDVKLYYNDYNDDNQNKAEAIYQMIKEINDRYAAAHNGDLLIDGMGMQSHYNLSTNPANVRLSLEKFSSVVDEVSITELDVTAGTNNELTEKQANEQAYLYAQLFQIYKEHADDIARVTIWGLDDATSWRAAQSPLLFDKDLQAKPAYYAVIDPEKFIAEYDPEEKEVNQGTASFGTPVIDGSIDDVWTNASELEVNRYQAAWQGANGVAKTLWDDENLYVLIQVSDSQLDKSSQNPWEQDSVEVFVDENNAKSSFYQEDDGQYRVNFDNESSFNPGSISEGFESATHVSGNGYAVELKIPFKTVTPEMEAKIGFDVQINDGQDGIRQSAATWNDLTGTGYQDTSVFGELTLVKADTQNPDPEKPGTEDPENPGKDDPEKPGTEKPEKPDTEKPEKPEKENPKTDNGKVLPKTATNTFNLFGIGALMLLVGIGFILFTRKRLAKS
ncbi:endo-1,4-beta-xylanase [Fredinandcohnia sp. 179-A 10B2 NHS]|uniref:endo-1,4-beta-xylanase n=1 Tax=Fredinandcohnia sp. 179-A 10B2 NHS TaxID=3235176 RepID=UPI0039A18134